MAGLRRPEANESKRRKEHQLGKLKNVAAAILSVRTSREVECGSLSLKLMNYEKRKRRSGGE